ncbi:cold shock domain-containing protein [Enterococcus canintestini]|uniref:cold-shock protein n=1 Tax=Enterococcus canintestini TaxID=317010 RepID=UPI002891C517|nr:cold shock domain-containing protein [Enterococcus canintestini]MDT2738410.1 cold shock domain-containing protein [Enterococcus canintestini]
MEGTVKSFNEKGGYGFLVNAHKQDMFVYQDDIVMPSDKMLFAGQRVTYEVATNQKGQQKAINVKLIN